MKQEMVVDEEIVDDEIARPDREVLDEQGVADLENQRGRCHLTNRATVMVTRISVPPAPPHFGSSLWPGRQCCQGRA